MLDRLPVPLFRRVMVHVEICDLARLAQVNRSVASLLRDARVWRDALQRRVVPLVRIRSHLLPRAKINSGLARQIVLLSAVEGTKRGRYSPSQRENAERFVSERSHIDFGRGGDGDDGGGGEARKLRSSLPVVRECGPFGSHKSLVLVAAGTSDCAQHFAAWFMGLAVETLAARHKRHPVAGPAGKPAPESPYSPDGGFVGANSLPGWERHCARWGADTEVLAVAFAGSDPPGKFWWYAKSKFAELVLRRLQGIVFLCDGFDFGSSFSQASEVSADPTLRQFNRYILNGIGSLSHAAGLELDGVPMLVLHTFDQDEPALVERVAMFHKNKDNDELALGPTRFFHKDDLAIGLHWLACCMRLTSRPMAESERREHTGPGSGRCEVS